MNTPNIKLVNVVHVLKRIGARVNTVRETDEAIKKYQITVLASTLAGRGVSRFMSAEQGDQLIAEHAPRPLATEPEDQSPCDATLHFGALETKTDRLVERLEGLNQTISELVKANNLLADRLDAMLKQLA